MSNDRRSQTHNQVGRWIPRAAILAGLLAASYILVVEVAGVPPPQWALAALVPLSTAMIIRHALS